MKELHELSKTELIHELQSLNTKYEAITQSARAILKQQEFRLSAEEIFTLCKKITGATSGYVALLSSDGSENEVLFLDSGGRECTVDENLPMPIRGLRATAYHNLTGVYDNDFDNSEWVKFMPHGNMTLDNVMFAPLLIDDQAVGLIGLANKAGGFNDQDVEFVSHLSDIAAVSLRNSKNLESVQYLSFHDQLTGLYNRHYLANEIKRLDNSRDYPVSIISADIDSLKKINDTQGHSEGDHYIKSFADIISKSIRSSDVAARSGGDEFVIVLPHTERQKADQIIKRINSNIESFNDKASTPNLEVSIGLSVCEQASDSLQLAFLNADKLMYEHKFSKK